MRPQKPSRDGRAKGALPVAVSVDVAGVAAGWLGLDDVVCARTGTARTAASGRAMSRRCFIIASSKLGSVWGSVRHASACVKFWSRPLNSTKCSRFVTRPAATQRWAVEPGAPGYLGPCTSYYRLDAKESIGAYRAKSLISKEIVVLTEAGR